MTPRLLVQRSFMWWTWYTALKSAMRHLENEEARGRHFKVLRGSNPGRLSTTVDIGIMRCQILDHIPQMKKRERV